MMFQHLGTSSFDSDTDQYSLPSSDIGSKFKDMKQGSLFNFLSQERQRYDQQVPNVLSLIICIFLLFFFLKYHMRIN